MDQDNLIDLKKPEAFVDDPLTAILRQGARRLLTAALEAEVQDFLHQYKEITDDKGCQRVVTALCWNVKSRLGLVKYRLEHLESVIDSPICITAGSGLLQLFYRHI